MDITNFTDLVVWQKALDLAKRLRFAPAAAIDLRLLRLSEVGKMLTGLSTSLEASRLTPDT